ncbi:hypothetical protein B0H34DRAFT_676131 [Crassisporium funariophilum]|nr:hypothetical protein B0H34DRAFT_676131 [Crassisporium funariophilum]
MPHFSLPAPPRAPLLKATFFNGKDVPLPPAEKPDPSSVYTLVGTPGKLPASIKENASKYEPQLDDATVYQVREAVRCRRWNPTFKVYSKWLSGQVMYSVGTSKTNIESDYMISFWDDTPGVLREEVFSISLNEIRPSSSPSKEGKKSKAPFLQNSLVLALMLVSNGVLAEWVWTPAICLGLDPPHGYKIRIIAGPLSNQIYSRAEEIRLHTAEVIMDLQRAGGKVDTSMLN